MRAARNIARFGFLARSCANTFDAPSTSKNETHTNLNFGFCYNGSHVSMVICESAET
jgi:hypothetical protein